MFVAITVTALWILGLCFHEFAHAIVAFAGGDKSIRDRGYLKLNPLNYIDPGASIILPTVILLLGGVALPGGAVIVNRQKLGNRMWESMVSLAGPFATAMFAVACAALAQADFSYEIRESLAFAAYLSCVVLILNLLPVPPLDGYGIWEPWLPKSLQEQLIPLSRYGFWILFALLWFVPFVNALLWRSGLSMALWLGLSPDIIFDGDAVFHRHAIPLGVGCIVIAVVTHRLKRSTKKAS
jgi:Zn-dependent protease